MLKMRQYKAGRDQLLETYELSGGCMVQKMTKSQLPDWRNITQ